MHLDGKAFGRDERFHFYLNLFDTKSPAIAYLVLTFAQLAREGLGPRRGRVELTDVTQLNEHGQACATIYDNGSLMSYQGIPPLELDLARTEQRVDRLRVQFITPTELKSGRHIASTPEFGILAARVRDRISTLRELYGGGALEIDFRVFGERAAAVRMTRCEIRNVDVMRRSSRSGQVHPIGGFVGEAEYEGALTEFVPYLKVAQWTGVGRQTVFGKGVISLRS